MTASKFGKICKMRQNTSCKNTVHELLYGQTNHKMKAIEYGRVMESVAKVKFEELFNLKIKSVGLCIDVEVPYLAASPGKINITISTAENIYTFRLFVNLICLMFMFLL